VEYLPRLKIAELVDFVSRSDSNFVTVRGIIGSGKSHILVAYVLYMLATSDMKVVYFPHCSTAAVNVHESLISALLIAMPEAANEIEVLSSLVEIRTFVSNKKKLGAKFLFVMDDWNFYDNPTVNSNVEEKKAIESILYYGKRIYGFSSNSDFVNSKSAGVTSIPAFVVNASLSGHTGRVVRCANHWRTHSRIL